MKMKLTKREKIAFHTVREPRTEPDYMAPAQQLMETLTSQQKEQLVLLLTAFGELVQYERRWYFQKGYRAAKNETP